MRRITTSLLALTGVALLAGAAEDWPMWGRTPERNMSGPARGLPVEFAPGQFIGASDEIDISTAKNVKWVAKLGSQSYGNPAISNGRVFLGTNNDSPRDPRYEGDRSVVMCLDEQTGALIWQINIPKMGTGKVSDWEYLGICSSPTVVGNRVYFMSNLCEVVCADVNGLADGNDGPFTDEGQYYAGKGKPPMELAPTDGDIIWTFNMIDECGVFPHNITTCAPLVVGDRIWVATSNGVDYGHVETPAPFAPSLIQLNAITGELIGEEDSGTGQRILHSNWSSPAWLESGDLKLCIFGGPDGWVYAFAPEPVEGEDGRMILDEVWRFDANPPEYRMRDGKPIKYATRAGPSEVLATPVVAGGKVYVAIGQDPEHGEGAGNIVCIDPTGKGDVTATHGVWSYNLINRSISTAAVVDGLLYVGDYSGFVYCFDAATGHLHWRHDTKGHIWGSPLVADGKVYIGNEDGYLTILAASKELQLLNEIDMMSPVYSSPVTANGVLYVQTHTHLFAIKETPE
ncbi:MAG: PQQ-binding-like beta-propeller repeat protein [Phycisphaeraceae bacterium]|nr:MAG: PQQ-binding-like beta-propeller repeat protein [Phycisphaeraceae bacterium]